MNRSNHRSRWIIKAATILSLVVVGYLDYVTGYEFAFSLFYFIPVLLCAWHFGRFAILSMALASGMTWWFVDKFSGHIYLHEGYRYWDGLTWLITFTVIGLGLYYLRHSMQEQVRVNEELARSMEELKRSSEEIKKLQQQIQVVCAWTKEIKVEGKWVPLEEFLTNQLHFKLSHGISPEAIRKFEGELEGKSEPPDSLNIFSDQNDR
jgi:K+-sensing histidine kinase KdpD